MRLRSSLLLLCSLLFAECCFATQKDSVEAVLIKTAADSEHAVLSVMYWGEDGQPQFPGVVGSAFLVNADGYFITAAHVLEKYEPNSGQLTVGFKQQNGMGSGIWFDIVEKNERYDLALCKVKGVVVRRLDSKKPKPSMFPVSTLDVSSETLQQGQFIAIVGFPLGSWNTAVQMGTVAATQTMNPSLPGSKAQHIQISASGNRGNSGGPVISLRTGKVVGVIVQAVPAPLWSNQPVPVMQNSGIMLAAPASWVRELMERNHVKSEAHGPKENLGAVSE